MFPPAGQPPPTAALAAAIPPGGGRLSPQAPAAILPSPGVTMALLPRAPRAWTLQRPAYRCSAPEASWVALADVIPSPASPSPDAHEPSSSAVPRTPGSRYHAGSANSSAVLPKFLQHRGSAQGSATAAPEEDAVAVAHSLCFSSLQPLASVQSHALDFSAGTRAGPGNRYRQGGRLRASRCHRAHPDRGAGRLGRRVGRMTQLRQTVSASRLKL